MKPSVHTVAVYGTANAGVRARALSFMDRLGVSHELVSYFDSGAAGLSHFIRSPMRAFHSELRLRRLLRDPPDRLLLSREASPLSSGTIEERLLRFSAHGVYDIDDALHLDIRSEPFEALFSKGRKAARAAGAADVVITGNSYLADWASSLNSEVCVVPSCVDSSAYRRKGNYEMGATPRLLWLGTASGEKYLTQVAAPLRRLRRETGATLTVIGHPGRRLHDLESIITRIPWSLDRAQQNVADHDIGLMPLADSPYERGKCAYKLLEYGAAGLPAVASPVGVNEGLLRESGCPAPSSSDEWYIALRDMIEKSTSDRAAIGNRLHDIVRRDFSFDRWLPNWSRAMDLSLDPPFQL